jgi:hypothetical protein
MQKPRGKTGPTTEQGKQISSRNAAKHNCTSTQLIVQGEDPAAFTALLESLTSEYQPETQMQQIIVGEAARAAWELARANREFDKSQTKLYGQQPDMCEWDAAQQSEFERMLRYRTRAERAYGRALQAVEYLRKLHLQAEQRAFWENLQAERLELSKQRLNLAVARMQKASEPKVNRNEAEKLAQEEEKAARRRLWAETPVPLSQIIEIRVLDGVTAIRIHPLAEDMLQSAARADPHAQVVRRFEFPHGVPAEYAWMNESPDIGRDGIVWEQRFFTVNAWRAHVAREAATAPGHFLPKEDP